MNNLREIKSFVKRASRISPYQKEAIEKFTNIFLFKEENLNIQNYLKNDCDTIIEIGFGMGDATYQIALDNQNNNYLAFEVHTPGIGRLLSKIDDYKIKNLKIIQADAKKVITENSMKNQIKGFHIFFPDPWHKKRHNKRRLLNEKFIDILVDDLQKDGYIYFVTDCEEYAENVIDIFSKNVNLKNISKENYERLDYRPWTKFEHKALEKKSRVYDILFRKEF